MEALTELCDLIAHHPDLFADKLSWICTRCPPPQSHHVTRSHLNSITSLARLLSKCSHLSPAISTVRSTLLDFLSSLPPFGFRLSFWPQSFSLDNISLFFSDLFRYLSLAADLSPEFCSDLSVLVGDIVVSAVVCGGEDRDVARVFLSAVAKNCPVVSDGERLVRCLVEQFFVGEDEGVSSSGLENSMKGKVVEEDRDRDVVDDGSSEISSVQNGGGGEGSNMYKGFWVETVEGLEKMEIAFTLVRRVLDRAERIKVGELELFHKVAAKQLKSLPGFLKVVVRMFLFEFFLCHLKGIC